MRELNEIKVQSFDYAGRACYLMVKETGEPVTIATPVFDKDGVEFEVRGGRAPHKPSSTGRVSVKTPWSDYLTEYFPSVFGLKWVPVDEVERR